MNKVALITGASRGIGASIALELSKKGYDIVINYNTSEEQAKILKKQIEEKYSNNVLIIKCDITKEEEINNMVKEALNHFSKIDILINNASLELNTEFDEKTKEDFIKTLDTNLVGPFLLSRLVGNIMYENKYGKIINISSNNAIKKYDPITLEYDASKAGLINLTHNLAKKYAPYINVNCITPGWIMSEKVKKLNDELSGMLENEESKKILKERFGKPEEVALLVSFLVSDEASYINDQVISIDGGLND